MENIYDLDEFSDDKDNCNESKEKNDFDFKNNSDNKYSSNNDLSLLKAFSAEKPQLPENNYLSGINSNSEIISKHSLGSNLLYEESIYHNINKNLNISPFSEEAEKKSRKLFAIEDNIEI